MDTTEAILDTGIMSASGNVFGGLLNYAANRDFQERQFAEQHRLQERAFQMNEQAVRNQAENMKLGMENAGLNPAMANGQGAPVTATGTAASGSSQLSQVFSGIAEMISAIKAPTEIEKTAAETGLVGAQTEKTGAETTRTGAETKHIFSDIKKIENEAKKASAETQNITNINNMFESEQTFLRNNSGAIFEGYIGQLKATDQWKNLPTKTKQTLESLAEGSLELDQGALNALGKIIDTQGNLSERDKQVLHNTKQMIIDYSQIKDKKVMDALKNMPLKDQEKLVQEVRKIKAEVNNIREHSKNLAKERIVMTKQGAMLESQAKKMSTEREIEELNDMQYLIEKGRYEDAARLGAMRAANDLWKTGNEILGEAGKTAINPVGSAVGKTMQSKMFR